MEVRDFKQASRVLRQLAERGNEVVQFEVKKGEKRIVVYKYAPERKILDRNYSRAQDLVGKAVIGYLKATGPRTQNVICGAMRQYFGYIDKATVKQTLETLRVAGTLHETAGARGRKCFRF